MNRKINNIIQITVSLLDELHKMKLYELEAYVSFGMDTGIRPRDLECVERANIVGNIVRGVKCHKTDNEYSDRVLSERTLSLLHYLPKQELLFPKKTYQYNSMIRKSTKNKDFILLYMRTYFVITKVTEHI